MLQKKKWSPRTYLTVILVLGLITGGCAALDPSPGLPTLIPDKYIPTAIALTANALVTQIPVVETVPTERVAAVSMPSDVETPTLLEAIKTNIPTPPISTPSNNLPASSPVPKPIVEIPFADIQIIRPGELSKVVAPVSFHAYLVPGADNRAQVALLGEDGRVIYRQIFVFNDSGVKAHLRADIDFEISGLAETARLVVQTQDARGRILSLVSQDIILLSMGAADINPSGDLLEPLLIESPNNRALIQGGVVTISGWARVQPDQLLLVELIAADGRVLVSRLAGVASAGDGSHGLFSIELPYQITAPTWARINVTERGIRLPGPLSVSGVAILLSP